MMLLRRGVLMSAKISASGWTPNDITTAAWWDASDSGTITESAGAVSQWDDKKGNGYDQVQATGADQPSTGVDTIGGLNTITFDGSNEDLTTAVNPFGATINDAFVFMVYDTRSNNTGYALSLTGRGFGAGPNQWSVYFDGTQYLDVGGNGGANRVSYATGWPSNNEVVMGWNCSTTDSVQEIWEDGVLKASDASGQSATTLEGIALAQSANIAIGEVVVINGVVTTDTRQKMEGYLAWKWGQEANLPIGHPYESSAP